MRGLGCLQVRGLEFPICSFDLKTGVLCPKCERKLQTGEITQLDIKVMQVLTEVEKQLPPLSYTTYVKSVQHNGNVFIVFNDGDLNKLNPAQQAAVRKKVSEAMGFRVKLLENSKDPYVFIQKVLAPARIATINKIWLPDQTEETRIVLEDERSLKIDPAAVALLVDTIKGLKIRLGFRRRFVRAGSKVH
jgi:transcription antitermination factor NusA-like protein